MMKRYLPIFPTLLIAALLFAGCGENAFEPSENRPPETGLAQTGDSLHTTLYLVNLKWWGSDTDGEVNGFEYRWIIPEGTEVHDLDTAWTYTGLVKKDFLLPVPDSTEAFQFEVRSIDNEGAVDPTPASQVYPFYNNRPTVYIRYPELLPDPDTVKAWPTLAFGWEAADRDGDSTIAKHLIWVKGQEDRPVEVSGELDTVLLYPADLDTFGLVTIYLQTVDNGYAASYPDSFDVDLLPIYGKTLLVDDLTLTPVPFIESFYRDQLTARLGAEGYTVLDLKQTPFDTDIRFAAFLTAFDDVLWYSGIRQRSVDDDQQSFEQMTLAEKGLVEFLDRGGDLFLSSLNAVGTLAGLSADFHTEYFGFDTLYTRAHEQGYTTSFTFRTSADTTHDPPLPQPPPPWESPFSATEEGGLLDLELRDYFQYVGIDAPLDTVDSFRAVPLYRVPAYTFVGQETDFYPSVQYDIPSPGGMTVLFTFPFGLYDGAGTNDDVLTEILDRFDVPTR